MPTYQYACTVCEHRFEAVQSFTDASLTTCPECEGRLRKVYSAVGVVFKGSGFYRTDSRSAATGDKAGDKPGDKPGDKAGDKPADTPAAKGGATSSQSKAASGSGTGGAKAAPAAGSSSGSASGSAA